MVTGNNTPPTRFKGYGRPRYTQTPNLFFDEQMQDLGLSELRTLLYVFRRTFGFQQDGAPIKFSDFVEGRVAADGRRLDRGTGLKANAVHEALRSLEARELIFRHPQSNSKDGSQATYYELNIDGLPHCTESCAVDCQAQGSHPLNDPPTDPTDDSPIHPMDDPSPPIVDDPPPPSTDETLSTIERKDLKERIPKERIPPPSPSNTARRHTPQGRAVEVVERDSEQVREDTKLLVQFGLDGETARGLARVAEENGRLKGYVAEQIAYAQNAPTITDPIAVLVANIRQNALRRTSPPPSKRRASNPAVVTRRSALHTIEPVEEATLHAPVPQATSASLAAQTWQTALGALHPTLSQDEYALVRSAHLLEWEPGLGGALLGAPSEQARRQIMQRLQELLEAMLSQIAQRPIHVFVVVAPGPGTPPASQPTLASLLATGEGNLQGIAPSSPPTGAGDALSGSGEGK